MTHHERELPDSTDPDTSEEIILLTEEVLAAEEPGQHPTETLPDAASELDDQEIIDLVEVLPSGESEALEPILEETEIDKDLFSLQPEAAEEEQAQAETGGSETRDIEDELDLFDDIGDEESGGEDPFSLLEETADSEDLFAEAKDTRDIEEELSFLDEGEARLDADLPDFASSPDLDTAAAHEALEMDEKAAAETPGEHSVIDLTDFAEEVVDDEAEAFLDTKEIFQDEVPEEEANTEEDYSLGLTMEISRPMTHEEGIVELAEIAESDTKDLDDTLDILEEQDFSDDDLDEKIEEIHFEEIFGISDDMIDNALEEEPIDGGLRGPEEITGSLGLPLDQAQEQTQPAAGLQTPTEPSAVAQTLSEGQLEAALERTILKLFNEKIESLLVSTVERTVAKEIKRLKELLFEEEAGGGKI